MNRNQSVLTGILAGVAAGLMLIAAFKAGIAAFLLIFTAAAAIYIVSMGWGSAAGIIATITASAIAGYAGGTELMVIGGFLLFIPAAWIGHWINLGQANNDNGSIVWFPLSNILFFLMLYLATAFILVGYVGGYSNETVAQAFSNLIGEMGRLNPDLPQLSEETRMERALAYANIIPLSVPAIWLMLHVLIANISAGITRRSGMLARGVDDIASTLSLPNAAIGLLLVGGIGSLALSGGLQLACEVIFGIAVAGFGLVGLAELHLRARGKSGSNFTLWAAYGSIVLFTIPIVIFALGGIYRSFIKNQRP